MRSLVAGVTPHALLLLLLLRLLPPCDVQEYAQLLEEVAGGRDLREAVRSSAKRVGLDLGEWGGHGRGGETV